MVEQQDENEIPYFWIGVDIAKKTFTAAAKSPLPVPVILPGADEFENNRTGARALCKWIRQLEEEHRFTVGVAMEATGIWSRQLYENLLKVRPGLHVAVCNPQLISYYRKSITLNKSDKGDAAIIAMYAAHVRPERLREASPDQDALQRLTRQRTSLVDIKTQCVNQLDSMRNPKDKTRFQCVIDEINSQLAALEKEISEYVTVKASMECREEIRLMETMPGVATLSAAVIYGELGSLANYTRKGLSAMSGVCPVMQESGTSLHRRGLSRRGPWRLRRILFLDVQQAIRRSPAMAEFHERMLGKDESSKMSARTACMRKLLLILRGIVVSGKPFEKNHVSVAPRTLSAPPENIEKKPVSV